MNDPAKDEEVVCKYLIAVYAERRSLGLSAPEAERFIAKLVEHNLQAADQSKLAPIFETGERRFRNAPPVSGFPETGSFLEYLAVKTDADARAEARPVAYRDEPVVDEALLARRTLAQALESARKRIKRGVYTEADASRLEAGIAAAGEALERLDHCLNALAEERPYLATQAWHNIDALFAAAISIGGLSTISESADARVVS